MAGEALTIADLCLIATVSSTDILVPVKGSKYPKLCAWIKRMQELAYYRESNGVGLQSFKKLFH